MELKQKASSTGFRVLFLLDLLLKAPMAKEDIINELSKNPLVQTVTKETIRLDLNTLKAAGFEIENTGKANSYKYKINWNPIKFKISKKELRVLLQTKDAILKLSEWEYILRLYGLFEKISALIKDNGKGDEAPNGLLDELLNFRYFSHVDFEILKDLNALTKRKKTVLLLYNSPNSGIKEIQIKLKEIKYTGSKLHIIGTSENYPDNTVLRADNILKIVKILSKNEECRKKGAIKKVAYKIKKEAFEYKNLLDEEKILKETDGEIEIELKSDNDFMIVQRLLSFGEDLISIKNKDIKEQYIDALNQIFKNYGRE